MEITEHDKETLLAYTQGREPIEHLTLETDSARTLWNNYQRNLDNLKKHFKAVVEKQKIKE